MGRRFAHTRIWVFWIVILAMCAGVALAEETDFVHPGKLRVQESPSSASADERYPWADVKRFGAKGDGVNDDTAAIARALTSPSQMTFLPAGVYKITSSIAIPPGKTLWGSGTSNTTIRFLKDERTAIELNNSGFLGAFKLESLGRNQTGIFVAGVHPVLRNIEISGFENIGLRLGTAGTIGAYFAQIDNVFVYNRTRQGNTGVLVDGNETPSSNANTFRNVFVKGRLTTFVNLKGNDNLWYGGDTEWDCSGSGVADVWLIEGVGNVVDGTYMESGNGVPDRVFRFTRNSSSNLVKDVYAAFVVNSISSKSVDEGWGNELSFKPVSPNLSFPGENTGITNLIQNSHFRSWSGKSPTGWMLNSGSFSRDSTNTRGGAYSLKAVASQDNPTIDCYIAGNRPFATGVPIEKFRGQMVTAGVWVKTGKAEMGNIKIWADGTGGGGYGNNRHTGNNTWQFLTATARVPNDATFLMVQLRGFGSGTGTGEAYFSEPILVEGVHLPIRRPPFSMTVFRGCRGRLSSITRLSSQAAIRRRRSRKATCLRPPILLPQRLRGSVTGMPGSKYRLFTEIPIPPSALRERPSRAIRALTGILPGTTI